LKPVGTGFKSKTGLVVSHGDDHSQVVAEILLIIHAESCELAVET
jgi:hypothetical protein